MKVLRLKFSAPTAHFRIAQSSNPRKTYPLPPYSTAIGLLANILGDYDKIDLMLKDSFALGILSQYESISNEYTWLRNLNSNAHKERFGSIENRTWQENVEHPGGQSPVVMQVLNEVEVFIYFYHPAKEILKALQENIHFPERWFSHLHLGRSEDWAAPCGACLIDLKLSKKPEDFCKARQYYQWMPEPENAFMLDETEIERDYRRLYEKMQGNLFLVTSLYAKEKVSWLDGKRKQVVTIRNFDHIPARLCKSQVPLLDAVTFPLIYCDTEIKTPVYLARIDVKKGGTSKYGT
ncbi:type I-B CRISPR-associated protein Cas5b [Calderihabitans maritimus]|uniref:CRISPR-associated protein Cas5 n=1 Tax=Calderihabitans maritimus TaxID=1246530 RepID=A0A1Z5HV23_9FIRM|nr:type I-B CRISPR-associated protein Cas5b [Calderihabitans maritimus]GAW93389.1 hypothetical protein Moth_1730 [Calderihabitans maritimus]